MKLSARRPSPSMLVAVAALVMAMSGAAVALPGKGEVKSNDIAEDAVKAKHIRKNAVRSQEVRGKSLKGNDLKDGAIKAKQIADDAVGSQQVEAKSLDSSDLADLEIDSALVRVGATEAATLAEARAAAPETELFGRGQLTIYAKCFRETAGAGTVRGEVYARTIADGAVLDGFDNLPDENAALLNGATAEEDRQLDIEGLSVADAADLSVGEGALASPDGTSLRVETTIGVKQGKLPAGDGTFGTGNVCLFAANVAG